LQTSAIVPRRFLGSTPPAAPVPAGMVNASSYCGSKCSQSINMPSGTTVQSTIQAAIQARALPDVTAQWATAKCTSAPASSTAAKVVQTGSIAAGSAVGVTGALVSSGIIASSAATAAIPIVGAIVAPIMLILGTIFSNHAKAVALQSSVECENVPAANAALQQIQSGVASGTITPQQAASAYAQLSASFSSAMKSDPSYKTGDALWLYDMCMQAVCAQCTLDLQNAPGGSGISVGGLSLSPAVLIGGLILFLLL
jgi:hypothetical protein